MSFRTYLILQFGSLGLSVPRFLRVLAAEPVMNWFGKALSCVFR